MSMQVEGRPIDVSLADVLADTARAAGLDPEDFTVPDVKISGYVVSQHFGQAECIAAIKRATQTFAFETPR